MGEEAGGTHVHMDETSKRQTRFSEDAGEGVLSQVALHSPLNRAHTPIMGQALIDLAPLGKSLSCFLLGLEIRRLFFYISWERPL